MEPTDDVHEKDGRRRTRVDLHQLRQLTALPRERVFTGRAAGGDATALHRPRPQHYTLCGEVARTTGRSLEVDHGEVSWRIASTPESSGSSGVMRSIRRTVECDRSGTHCVHPRCQHDLSTSHYGITSAWSNTEEGLICGTTSWIGYVKGA